MKYKSDDVDWKNGDIDGNADETQPKTRHNKCQPWHKLHRKAIDNTDPNLYPALYEIKGKKTKISLAPLESLQSDAEQIYNLNRNYFKNISHVHALAHYRGMADLQYQFVVKKGGKARTIVSEFLAETELEREIDSEIERALAIISAEVDKVKKRVNSRDSYLKIEQKLLHKFEKVGLGERLRSAIDELFENGEEDKSANRVRVSRHREKAKALNIKVLDQNKE